MINYLDTANTLHTRMIEYTPEQYFFVLQVVLGESVDVAYAVTFDTEGFRRNIATEDEDKYFASFHRDATIMLETQECRQLKEELEELYRSDIQSKATTLSDYKFSGEDVQKLLANLLHDRTQDLSESSVRDILSLIKTMYENGSLDSGDTFQKHFVVIPNKYNAMCSQCNHELNAVDGLDIRCAYCGQIYKWDESEKRFYPHFAKL